MGCRPGPLLLASLLAAAAAVRNVGEGRAPPPAHREAAGARPAAPASREPPSVRKLVVAKPAEAAPAVPPDQAHQQHHRFVHLPLVLASKSSEPKPARAAGRTEGGASLAAILPNTRLHPQVLAAEVENEDGGDSNSRGSASNSTELAFPRREEEQDHGGTACQCICGDRVVWHRELFATNVTEAKEEECKRDICPFVNIPGLAVIAECTYVRDVRELTAGTICFCQCGDKAAWVNRGFYGNVTEEKERECIQTICPRVNPLPGLIHRASCRFDPNLFTLHRPEPPTVPPPGAAWPHARPLPPLLLALSAWPLLGRGAA